MDERNYCKKCGSHFFTHNSDGSCPDEEYAELRRVVITVKGGAIEDISAPDDVEIVTIDKDLCESHYEVVVSFTYDADGPVDAAQQLIDQLRDPNIDWYVSVKDVADGIVYTVNTGDWTVEDSFGDLSHDSQ